MRMSQVGIARILIVLSVLVACCRRPAPPVVQRPPVRKPVAVKPAPPKPKPAPAQVAVTTPPLPLTVASAATFDTTMPPKREFRAIWIATVDNIDWPSRKALPVADQQREFRELLDMSRQTGLNAVVVQVRAAADAFYAQGPEPWSEWLTGQQGLPPNPLYDPLTFMLDEAHGRNLEFHAWLNLDRGTFSTRASVATGHITQRQPGWFVRYGERKLFNLGMPEVRAYIAGVAANIVRNYDVDGIHFDDYFYPYAVPGQTFNDDVAYKEYGDGLSRNDWRRQNVDAVMYQIRDSIKAVRPTVKFGISPFGIWKNKASDPNGSATNGGQAYYDLYADTRQWALDGLADYMVPQIYFSTSFGRAPYRELVDWWSQNRGRGHLYIGQGAYRQGNGKPDTAWLNPRQMPTQLRYNRQQPAVTGSVYFSAQSLRRNLSNFRDSLRTNFYRYPALIPPMPWLDNVAPSLPRDLKIATLPEGVELFWQEPLPAPDGDRARYYALYRFLAGQPLNLSDPRALVAILPGELNTRYVDTSAKPQQRYVYVVTAFDRLHNESAGLVIAAGGTGAVSAGK